MIFPVCALVLFGTLANVAQADLPLPNLAIINNNVLKLLDFIEAHMVRSLEDNSDPMKVQFSLFATTVLHYLNVQRVLEPRYVAVKEVSDLAIYQSADLFSEPVRKNLDYFRAYITLPLSDVKQACTFNITETDCLLGVQMRTTYRKEYCKGYDAHVQLHKQTMDLVNYTDLNRLLNEVLAVIKFNANLRTFTFFTESVLNYPTVYENLKSVNDILLNNKFPCVDLYNAGPLK